MSHRIAFSSAQTTLEPNGVPTGREESKELPVIVKVKDNSSIVKFMREVKSSEVSDLASIIKRAEPGQLIRLPSEVARARPKSTFLGGLGRILFAACTEQTRASRLQEMRETNELKKQITEIVIANNGDASMIPAMTVAVKELLALQGDFGPVKDDISVLLKFSDARTSDQSFSVSVKGYDVRAISEDALSKARVACQHQLADQTLTCVCVVGGSHTVTLTVDRDAFVEEEDD